jgi:TolB-like protein
MQAVDEKTYCFEGYALDLRRGCLRSEDRDVELRPKSFEVLRYLLENAGRLVAKDELIRAVWPNVIATDESLTRCISEVRFALQDQAQRIIKTVPRRGYLLDAPVSHPALEPGCGAKPPVIAPAAMVRAEAPASNAVQSAIGDTGEKQHLIKTPPRKGFRFVATVQEDQKRTVEPVGSAVRSGDTTQAQTSAARLSIVVLPFANLSGDPEQDYFVDGVTESLTTDLSHIAGSFVIACNTAFTYKGKAIDVKKIGRELNVRYVLEGSVQRGGNRLRINAQLIDVEIGNHLWAERFDKPITDLFDMQDEIVSRLANALDTQLIAAEAQRSQRSLHPDAMDLCFQGMACWHKGLTNEYLAQSRGLYERALALDPGNAEALVGIANADVALGVAGYADDRSARLAEAEATLIKALSIAPRHARAHAILGVVQISTNRSAQGVAKCKQALELDRNFAMAHAFIGAAKSQLGRAAETEAHVNEALRLSPRDTFAGYWMVWVGLAKVYLSADAEAVTWLRQGLERNYNYPAGHFALAAAQALLGSQSEARAAANAGLALDPTFTMRLYRAGAMSDNPIYLAGRERIYQGMRIAGVPEG